MPDPEPAPTGAESIPYHAADQLPSIRAFVRTHAITLGLSRERADLLALAVSELVTNALQHTTAGGHVLVWAANGRLTCDVTDSGQTRILGRPMPPADAYGGRGLPIVERVCDEVSIHTAASGTLTRLRLVL